MLPVKIKKLSPDAIIPKYAKDGDAGVDICAAEDAIVNPGEHRLIHTGLAFSFPRGYEAQIRPRSGLALKHAISIVNSPATIDSGYRGEWGIILINHGKAPFKVDTGMRIAQAVFKKVEEAVFEEVNELDQTPRGVTGYGSSGV